MSELLLIVGGLAYGGWTEVDVRLGVERVAGSFELRVVELWPDQSAVREIPVGASCEIRIDGETVISGWVDEVAPEYDADNHVVAVRGRDATGDLVDCSAWPLTAWTSPQRIGDVATLLCEPFGVGVVVTADAPKLQQWKVHPGETVVDNLQRAARQLGLLLMSDGKRNLIIGRASSARLATALERGVNIKSSAGSRNHIERHSSYRVLAQNSMSADAGYDTAATEVMAEVADPAITRYRPLVILAEDAGTLGSAKQRADWEMRGRVARAVNIQVTVVGWRHADGLWRPDVTVPVRDPWMRVADDMYVSAVQYRLSADGTTAVLTLTLPGAFDVLPLPAEEPL